MPQIEYRTYGKGEPEVVVLHGGPGAPGSAEGLAKGLADKFKVIEPIQRCSGELPLTVERHVEDLQDIFPPQTVLVGWSWGAMLGLSFTARYADMVKALVLIGCGTYSEKDRSLIPLAMLSRLSEKEREALVSFHKAFSAKGDSEKKNSCFKKLGELSSKVSIFEQNFDPDEADNQLPVDYLGFEQTWNDVLRLQRENIEPQIFKNIKVPVLMVHGDFDIHPGPQTRNTLRKFIPHLEYAELEHCGHEPWREKHAKDNFFDIISNWIYDKR